MHKLSNKFPFVDFESQFHHPSNSTESCWWYSPPEIEDVHEEWRPHGAGQVYHCPGEPEAHFSHRMTQLYDWIQQRREDIIVIVTHWGVIEYLTGQDFYNCECKVLDVDDLRREGFREKVKHD